MSQFDRSARPLSASIETLRRQLGLGSSTACAVIEEHWSEVVGSDLAARCHLVELRQGVLFVDADDPATAEAMSWAKRRMLDEIAARCPDETVTDVTVRVRRPRRR